MGTGFVMFSSNASTWMSRLRSMATVETRYGERSSQNKKSALSS